ncbi:PREDICTED: F-box/LRR-repeat protein 16 [Bactrocera latifrons]|uniref:F-box/LRR-repeat protein 16 n=1 Tax=Bactrocera latifrons TaxID=174628 RepID=UPI0008DCBA1D|nr:PREDICTED: F-box/LRR-repeat protein 16 [Bactrocera latifrons]XP_018800994.1 PREDICTED: F-box/LRR-repeat protein 16 [Bactrocera latifrons]XP_018800995.1 PREDICTED: F-box/LRR-repeat protein 16 [Bactrocera latifrons]
MSSISAQGVVERASAELSKRINGLGLRSKHHHGSGSNSSTSSSTQSATSSGGSSGKTSVMERVTNALCGGGNSNNNSNNSNNSGANNSANNSNPAVTPDKPTRGGSGTNSGTHTPTGSLSTPASPTLPHTVLIGAGNNMQLLQQQQTAPQAQQPPSHPHQHSQPPAPTPPTPSQHPLQSQIASSTLVNSNSNMLGGTPPVLGHPLGAPPAPTVNSIAKQMNITIPGQPQFNTMGLVAAQKSVANQSVSGGTPLQLRKHLPNPHLHHPYASGGVGGGVAAVLPSGTAGSASNVSQLAAAVTQSALILHKYPPPITSIEALLLDDRFLNRFLLYFSSYERRTLAQVCMKWRDILYRSPRYWSGLLPTLQCRELRQIPSCDRVKLYNSLIRRGFHALALVGASDEDALDVVHSFPLASKHIHSLSLRCSSISDRGLEALLDHLQSLFELELAGCNEVTEAGLWACLTPRIVSLSLADCINIADEAVGAVAQLLPSLYEFSLQAYHVTDAALGYFSPKQSHSLSILRLQSCWELTNHGIVNIVHSLPHLTVLSLSGCSKLTDDGVELIAENLQKLRALDLSWCPRITDASLEYIACDLNQLEELTLDRCVHITDIGVGYISTMLSLTALFLRWCSQVRDFGLQHLCSMRNLQVLSLAGCPLLTSSGLSSLIQLRHLQELELTNCPGASHELFDYLKEHLPRCLIIE